MKWEPFVYLLKETARRWYDGNTFQIGAALAYYGVFAIAPTLVIALGIAGLIFGPEAAQGLLTARLDQTVGHTIAVAIEDSLRYAHFKGTSWMATVFGVVGLVIGSLGLFTQLQTSLNTIFEVTPRPGRGVWGVIHDRLLSFLMVLVIGALLLAALAGNTVLSMIVHYFPWTNLPGGIVLWEILRWAVSIVLLTLLFGVVYILLPDVRITCREVALGAAVTAVLFTVGNFLIGLYLGQSGVADAYGAAGSLVIILLWVYYSSQVVLFGAEFVKVYADRYGVPLQPASNAVRLRCEDRVRQGIPNQRDIEQPMHPV